MIVSILHRWSFKRLTKHENATISFNYNHYVAKFLILKSKKLSNVFIGLDHESLRLTTYRDISSSGKERQSRIGKL